MNEIMLQNRLKEYTILISPDEESGGFTVEVPALPGCVTDGPTVEKAKQNAVEAIELYLQTLDERGISYPDDTEPNFIRQKVSVSLSQLKEE